MQTDAFAVGDLVFIGAPAPLTEKVVWRVVSINRAADDITYATVRSGMTERTATVPIERLHRFVARLKEPAHA